MEYFFSIFIGTFILEDLAMASSLVLMAENKISFQGAFLACFLGITIGDIGLYFIGYLASRFKIEKHFKFFKKHRATLSKMKLSKGLTYSIVISRVLPGTRLPTYLASGFLRYPFFNFVMLTIVSVFFWVLIALVGGKSLHYIFRDQWFLSLVMFLVFLQLMKSFLPQLADRWKRKALMHSWRKWLHFEFWPGTFFYLPIIPYYIYLSLRYRSFLLPFYASPHLKHGGLIGESKWDILQHLDSKDSSTLKTFKISPDFNFLETLKFLEEQDMKYPFIIKPDVGQRGFGVRIIRNDFDLKEYLLLSQSDRILQKLSLLPFEAGVFYIRKPSNDVGFIFSITDKKFPSVMGDGVTRLGDLILKDPRARVVANIYFARHQKRLDSVPLKNQVVLISECGNHCQGAIFKNGKDLITDKLTQEMDRIARKIPDFYFGRFDIRYADTASLMRGESFEIVEINGSGSEATHIWDAKTKLWDAYKTLFTQWRILFEIGNEIKHRPNNQVQVDIKSFLKDCAKVAFRKDGLSVSS